MIHKRRMIRRLFPGAAVFSALFLSGCMGPTTRVLPRVPEHQASGYVDTASSREEVNAFYLWETIEFLSGGSREPGSLGAEQSASYMKQLLIDYGYQTEISGGIVSAVRAADSQEADIVILFSDYGSQPGSPGASDNASGIAAFLETARLLADVEESDTELRFVALPGSGSGQEAARAYTDSLTAEEKHRIIGAVQIGPLGYSASRTVVLGTEDGGKTFLGDQISAAAKAMTGSDYEYAVREGGSAAVFWRGEIAAVVLEQRDEAFERGTVLDRLEWIDVDQLVPVVNVLRRTLTELMDDSTPSMIAKSHHYNDLRDGAYIQQREAAIPFGEDRSVLEERTGQTGTPYSQNTTNDGRPMEAYRYPMKWFGVDQILMTDYYFVGGKLALVSLEADGAGVDTEDMKERISDVYGEPDAVSEGPGGTEYRWSVPFCRLNIAMIPNSDGYELEIRELDTPRTEISPEDTRADGLKELIWQILPPKEAEFITVSIYTDGIGKTEYDLEPSKELQDEDGGGQDEDRRQADGEADETADGQEEQSWILGIDLEDAVREDGSLRSRTETIRQILKLYGQILAQRDGGKLQAAFDARFGNPERQEEDGASGAEAGISGAEAAETGISGAEDGSGAVLSEGPDFAESFRWYVLVKDPKILTGTWGERIRFFENFEELAEYREWARNSLGLPEIEEVVVGESPS